MNSLHLSETFLEKMKQLLGGGYEEYLACYEEEPFYGLRVNTLKVTPEAFAAAAEHEGWELTPVPWVSNGYYYKNEQRPARHPWYFAGLYYLQEPSAMTPASLLPVEPGDKVLDLCAAPGGKSTELAAKLQGKGLLFSNDISNSRAKALLKNLELFGAGNICVSSETPEKLAGSFEEFFDKILVDAPCSGEGMFRRDPDMVKSYEEKGPSYYAPIQRSIVSAAVKMLAPGGMLLYSTCTFDENEDEGTIRYLLEEFPELHLLPLEKKEGFAPGIGMPECVRLFPHKIKGEGHFIALLQKEAAEERAVLERPAEVTGTGTTATDLRLLEPVLEFLTQLPGEWEQSRFHVVKEQVYYLPAPFGGVKKSRLKGIRCLRTGLLLGEVFKGRFEPSQALAMTLKADEYPCVFHLSPADDRTVRYLKGETLQLSEEEVWKLRNIKPGSVSGGEGGSEKGKKKKDRTSGGGNASWCLICVDGQPLGWAKLQNQSLKNKYYPGWRWQ